MAVDPWPSERAGKPPKVPFLHRRKRLARELLWSKTHAEHVRSYEFLQSPRPIERGGSHLDLLSEYEAQRIRELAKIDGVFWLDPDQQAITVEIPTEDFIEYRVEAYHWPGIKERDTNGSPTGYMVEQEENIQILVGREIRKGRVYREWEHDFEQVPLYHFIDRGCFGESRWRSKFAEHIPARVRG